MQAVQVLEADVAIAGTTLAQAGEALTAVKAEGAFTLRALGPGLGAA